MDTLLKTTAVRRYLDWPMASDELGSDFSAIRAHATLEMHMKECGERQAEVRANFATIHGRLDAMMASFDKRMAAQEESFDKRMAAQESSFDKRMTAISNRMWVAAGAVISCLGFLAFHFATKGLHP